MGRWILYHCASSPNRPKFLEHYPTVVLNVGKPGENKTIPQPLTIHLAGQREGNFKSVLVPLNSTDDFVTVFTPVCSSTLLCCWVTYREPL